MEYLVMTKGGQPIDVCTLEEFCARYRGALKEYNLFNMEGGV